MSMSNSPKTCANCQFYRKIDYGFGRKPHMECDGPAAMFVQADADDDTNLSSSFQPPPQFSCSGWIEKA